MGIVFLVWAANEAFWAAASIDLIYDEADKEQKISCSCVVPWSAKSMRASFDMLKTWKENDVYGQGRAFECGHFLPEEKWEGRGTHPLFILTSRIQSGRFISF